MAIADLQPFFVCTFAIDLYVRNIAEVRTTIACGHLHQFSPTSNLPTGPQEF